MNIQPTSSIRLHRRWLILARAGWLAFALLVAGFFVSAVPVRFRELLTVTPEAAAAVGQLRPQDVEGIHQLGLSIGFYAVYFTTLDTLTVLSYFVIALLVFWRRPDDGMALFVALTLLFVALAPPVLSALERAQASWRLPVLPTQVVFVGCMVPLLFLFPDGRWVPRWARWLILIWVGYVLTGLIVPSLLPPNAFGSALAPQQLLPAAWMLCWFGAGLAAQIYRYYRVSTPTQRQQTKWVVFGFAICLALVSVGVLVLIPPLRDPNGSINMVFRMMGPTLILAGAMTVPWSLGLSILRYRLWDIDLIIRRTLVYSVLTGALALAYFSSVVLLQRIFASLTGQQQNEIVTVISTLAIAGLSIPLRRRVQDLIDRRFYRKKYDAAKTLAAFAATCRDETDLDKLTARLVEVVQETMQPEHVSLWLRASPKRTEQHE